MEAELVRKTKEKNSTLGQVMKAKQNIIHHTSCGSLSAALKLLQSTRHYHITMQYPFQCFTDEPSCSRKESDYRIQKSV